MSHKLLSPPERQPRYRSSTPNEEASPRTSGGAAPNVRSPTPLIFPYHSPPLSLVRTPASPYLIVPTDQVSPRSPDGSGRGFRYRDLPQPNAPKVAFRLNVQSTPAG